MGIGDEHRIAVAIIQRAEQRGLLRRGATLIEATAGNTGTGLALVAAIRGYKLDCVMPEKMSHDKRAALAALGAQVIITPNRAPGHAENFQNVAARLAHENGWFFTDQFRHPAGIVGDRQKSLSLTAKKGTTLATERKGDRLPS